MTFDTWNDFAPVTLLIKVPNVLVVNPSSKINSVADVKAEDKTSEHTLYYASSGPGSAQHLAGELFNVLGGTQLIHVTYTGGGPAMIDVCGTQEIGSESCRARVCQYGKRSAAAGLLTKT